MHEKLPMVVEPHLPLEQIAAWKALQGYARRDEMIRKREDLRNRFRVGPFPLVAEDVGLYIDAYGIPGQFVDPLLFDKQGVDPDEYHRIAENGCRKLAKMANGTDRIATVRCALAIPDAYGEAAIVFTGSRKGKILLPHELKFGPGGWDFDYAVRLRGEPVPISQMGEAKHSTSMRFAAYRALYGFIFPQTLPDIMADIEQEKKDIEWREAQIGNPRGDPIW